MSTSAGVDAGSGTVAGGNPSDSAVPNDAASRGVFRADAADGVGSTCEAVARVREGVVSGSGWAGIDVDSLPRPDLLATHRDLARMGREIAAMIAYSAAAIARRSTREDGQDGLAKREGYRTPEELIASISGGSTSEAHRLIEVGDMLAADEHATRTGNQADTDGADSESASHGGDAGTGAGVGEGAGQGAGDELGAGAGADAGASTGAGVGAGGAPVVSPRFAVVSNHVRSGTLSIDNANLIRRMLTRIWDRRQVLNIDLNDVERVERILVERAYGLSSNKFSHVVRQLEAQMDTERHKLTEQLQYQDRSVSMWDDTDGMFNIRARLDAESAAPVRAAINALVGNAMHAKNNTNQVDVDDRTVPQMRADALATLARHCLGCTSKDLPYASTTVVVRMTLSDLQAGTGIADIDGGHQPVSIETARRMAANGGIIPIVLGGHGEILDLGHEERLFNYYQRLALIERDGGCAFCGAPPAYTEAHHIKWWTRDNGPTDLNNGLLLCSVCHHRIHHDNWDITIKNNQVWFTPPFTIDPTRTPRLGGKARYNPPPQPTPHTQTA